MLSPRYLDALGLAFELHRAQLRKGAGIPYLSHLMAVSGLVMEFGGDEDEAIAGLLHDAAEDQGGEPTLRRIRAQFGEGVAAIVAGCTDAMEEPKPPWRARKEAYIAHLATASPRVHLVSACDKLHNARAIVLDLRRIGAALWPRFSGGRDGTVWYYGELARALSAAGAPPAAELARVVGELTALA